MRYRNLAEFVKRLESRGELRRVDVPVCPDLEIAEIADRLVKRGGPAVLFERVEGTSFPVAVNLFGTPRRIAWGLGVERLDELGDRVAGLLDRVLSGVPATIGDKVRLLGQVRELAGTRPRNVRTAP